MGKQLTDNFDLIERYIDGSLTREERTKVEERLHEDPEFKIHYDVCMAVVEGIKEARKDELRDYLKQYARQETLSKGWGKSWMVAAAAVAVIFVAMYFVVDQFLPRRIQDTELAEQVEEVATDAEAPDEANEKVLTDEQNEKPLTDIKGNKLESNAEQQSEDLVKAEEKEASTALEDPGETLKEKAFMPPPPPAIEIVEDDAEIYEDDMEIAEEMPEFEESFEPEDENLFDIQEDQKVLTRILPVNSLEIIGEFDNSDKERADSSVVFKADSTEQQVLSKATFYWTFGDGTDSAYTRAYKSDKQSDLTVEFWKSPLNYRGYRYQNQTLVLYGIAEPEDVKVFSVEQQLYLRYQNNTYSITPTRRFTPYRNAPQRIIDDYFPSQD